MKKPELDLSRENCHCCGNPLTKNLTEEKEWCTYFACEIKGVEFSIPYVDEGGEDERD